MALPYPSPIILERFTSLPNLAVDRADIVAIFACPADVGGLANTIVFKSGAVIEVDRGTARRLLESYRAPDHASGAPADR
jgi:hypothetical protein